MAYQVRRDFVGYGANPPDPKWPDGARLAVNFVLNYEEGSEPSVQDGEGHTDTGLTDAHGMGQTIQGRDLAGESLFEYGSRVGFWRINRLFRERDLPMTIYGCGAGVRAQSRGLEGDQGGGLRHLLARLALDQALRALRGGRARAHPQGDRLDGRR